MFGKSKEDKNDDNKQDEKIEFQNIIVDTENINQELKNVSSAKNIPLHELDFRLISFKSVYKADKDGEWIKINDKNINYFKDEDFLLNEYLQIKQQYKVEIFKRNENDILPIDIVLGGNKYLTKVIATVKKNYDIKYSSKLKDFIIEQIYKKLMKQSILISICENEIESEVEKIVSKIRVYNFLDADQSFVVCHCSDPIKPVNDDLIFHYKKNINKQDKQGRVDYSKRGYIQAVQKDDIIIEYIKPKDGKNGRNCKGEFLKVKQPKIKYKIDFNISDNIEKKEDEDKIIFIAKKNGYVNKDGNKYDINDKMELNEISFKTTGSIETNVDADVKINIKEADIYKDAIGQGMVVETMEIKVEGNVGSSAVIRAKIADIGGQTHKTSKIYADKLNIKVHRGYAEGNQVKIERLEGGKVKAKTVEVEQAIGGEIIAESIVIKKINSNTTVIASKTIEIYELKGTNNKFIIDPTMIPGFQEKIEKLNQKMKKSESLLQFLKKTIRDKKRIIEKNREPAEMVKDKIMELKRAGQEPAKALIKKIRDFQELIGSYNKILDQYKKEQQEREAIKKEIDEAQSTLFKAKIINHSIWTEYNEIKFVLLSPKIEVIRTTKEGEIAKEITLKKIGEGEYDINRKSEFGS